MICTINNALAGCLTAFSGYHTLLIESILIPSRVFGFALVGCNVSAVWSKFELFIFITLYGDTRIDQMCFYDE